MVTIIHCPTHVTHGATFSVQVDQETEMDAIKEKGQIYRTFGLTKAEACIQQVSTSKPRFSRMTGAPFPICFDGSCMQLHEAASSFSPNSSFKNKPVRRKPPNSYLRWTSRGMTTVRLSFSPICWGGTKGKKKKAFHLPHHVLCV